MIEDKKSRLEEIGTRIVEIVNSSSVKPADIKVKGRRGNALTEEAWSALKSAIKNGGEKGKIPPSFVEDLRRGLSDQNEKELASLVIKYEILYEEVHGKTGIRDNYFPPSLERVKSIYDSVSRGRIISIDHYYENSGDSSCYYPLTSILLFISLLYERKIQTDHNFQFAYPLYCLVSKREQYFKNILQSVCVGDRLPITVRTEEAVQLVETLFRNKTAIEVINLILELDEDEIGDIFRWRFQKKGKCIQIDVNYCYEIERTFLFVSK